MRYRQSRSPKRSIRVSEATLAPTHSAARRGAAPVHAEEPRHAIALIGDLVRSRELAPAQRSAVQRRLEEVLSELNRRYRRAIAARFLVTLGDEFQGLLKEAHSIPDIVWDIGTWLPRAKVRLGIGYGIVHPPFKPLALGMDGPAFHAARQAVELARKEDRAGPVFSGFGAVDDVVLNGLARLLHQITDRLTEAQRETVDLLRRGQTMSEIGRSLRITRQAVGERASSAGWKGIAEGERAWRATLARFDPSAEWQTSAR
ncbi:MAG TPA: SatD family protein [Gemmatimonadales bacterium]|nr:SatD family protein [Gemmatimonadales bacterium]